MGTALDPGPYDMLARALPDEPRFVLLARDPLAPFLVRLWSDLRVCKHSNEAWTTLRDASRVAWALYADEPTAQAGEAAGIASAMTQWRAHNDARWRTDKPSPAIGLPLSRAEYEALVRTIEELKTELKEGFSTMATQVDQMNAGLAALATDIDKELAAHQVALEAAQRTQSVDLSGPLATIASLRAKLGDTIAAGPGDTAAEATGDTGATAGAGAEAGTEQAAS